MGITTKVLSVTTHCSLECGEGSHTDEYTTCDRCGAHVHKRVFEVERVLENGTVEVENLSVGTECFKDVMGYSWKKAHDKALEIVVQLTEMIEKVSANRRLSTDSRIVKDIKEIRMSLGRYPKVGIPNSRNEYNNKPIWTDYQIELKYGFSATIARAGEDLGLWSQKGGYYWINFQG